MQTVIRSPSGPYSGGAPSASRLRHSPQGNASSLMAPPRPGPEGKSTRTGASPTTRRGLPPPGGNCNPCAKCRHFLPIVNPYRASAVSISSPPAAPRAPRPPSPAATGSSPHRRAGAGTPSPDPLSGAWRSRPWPSPVHGRRGASGRGNRDGVARSPKTPSKPGRSPSPPLHPAPLAHSRLVALRAHVRIELATMRRIGFATP